MSKPNMDNMVSLSSRDFYCFDAFADFADKLQYDMEHFKDDDPVGGIVTGVLVGFIIDPDTDQIGGYYIPPEKLDEYYGVDEKESFGGAGDKVEVFNKKQGIFERLSQEDFAKEMETNPDDYALSDIEQPFDSNEEMDERIDEIKEVLMPGVENVSKLMTLICKLKATYSADYKGSKPKEIN